MAGPGLSTTVDFDNADSTTGDATVKRHQMDHDTSHAILNKIDKDAAPADGQVLTWASGSNVYLPATLPSALNPASYVSKTGDSTINGSLTTNGQVGARGGLYIGGGAGSVPRSPFGVVIDINGSTLDGTGLVDKVGQQTNVKFTGNFSGEAGFGAADPGFVWLANDFQTTGTAAGDCTGLTDLTVRLIEAHAMAPGINLNVLQALQVEAHLEPSATGGHIANLYGISIIAPRNGGTIDNAYGLHIDSPTTATNNYSIFVTGSAESVFYGPITLINRLAVKSSADGDVVAQFRGRGGQTANIVEILHDGYGQPAARFSNLGVFVQSYPMAPADSSLVNNECSMWIDGTSGAMKVWFKGRDNGGTIRTAS